jgi:hypothetical protein
MFWRGERDIKRYFPFCVSLFRTARLLPELLVNIEKTAISEIELFFRCGEKLREKNFVYQKEGKWVN